jgi:hypothetical protein
MKSNKKSAGKNGNHNGTPTSINEPTTSALNKEEVFALIHHLRRAEDNNGIISLLTPLLKDEPNNHAIMILLGQAHMNKGKLQKALLYHMDSLLIRNCVHSTWHMALYMKTAGQVDLAIELWKGIIDYRDSTNPQECSPCNCCCDVFDERVAVIANSKFMISVSYLQSNRPRLSLKWKRDYIRDLEAGVKGMYPAEVIDQLKEVKRYDYVEGEENQS